MSDTPRTDVFCRTVDHTAVVDGKIYQATIETVDASFARLLERELAEARAEIKKLHSILSTIRAADFDVEELRGHQCCAKQWACALRDRLKRLEAEK